MLLLLLFVFDWLMALTLANNQTNKQTKIIDMYWWHQCRHCVVSCVLGQCWDLFLVLVMTRVFFHFHFQKCMCSQCSEFLLCQNVWIFMSVDCFVCVRNVWIFFLFFWNVCVLNVPSFFVVAECMNPYVCCLFFVRNVWIMMFVDLCCWMLLDLMMFIFCLQIRCAPLLFVVVFLCFVIVRDPLGLGMDLHQTHCFILFRAI